MTYSSTFIFEIKQLDDEFHRLNDEIAQRARTLPGFLGEEAWHNEDVGLHAEVYYWSDMESLQRLVGMDTHGTAKGRHGDWLGEYRVVISEVRSVYGNPALGLAHVPKSREASAPGLPVAPDSSTAPTSPAPGRPRS
jgi:heme-degrading monooxygenase HmoA